MHALELLITLHEHAANLEERQLSVCNQTTQDAA